MARRFGQRARRFFGMACRIDSLACLFSVMACRFRAEVHYYFGKRELLTQELQPFLPMLRQAGAFLKAFNGRSGMDVGRLSYCSFAFGLFGGFQRFQKRLLVRCSLISTHSLH